ncbi:MAG: exosortase/archaeosortase family protein, partial [Chthoniobacterales bacterium]
MKVSSIPRPALWLVLYPLALWLWLCWACAGEWLQNSDYQYGFLMLPLAAYFFARNIPKYSFRSTNLSTPVAWGILFVTALLVLPLELFRLSPLYWRLLLWIIGLLAAVATLTISHILGGKSLIKSLVFPVCFLLLAIPWPTFLEQGITFPLMTLVTTTVGEAMLLIGVPAQISGTTIVLPGCIVGIEEACSGLHSFQTALILSLAAG